MVAGCLSLGNTNEATWSLDLTSAEKDVEAMQGQHERELLRNE